jgi:4'-phosphopantetheinyl transferase
VLHRPSDRIEALTQLLSLDESERARRFGTELLRSRFIVARGLLRVILSRYLDLAPADIRFTKNEYGKPRVELDATPEVRFNLSHSGDIALYAFALGSEVGVDVEQVKEVSDAARLARRFFSPHEAQALLALPAEQQLAGFFNCWTRKEAYVKAIGKGMAQPLSQFAVSFQPNEPARLISANGDVRAPERWSLHDLSVAPGYIAAVAVEGQDKMLRRWRAD